MRYLIVSLSAVFLLATPASGDAGPAPTKVGGGVCTSYLMCAAQTATGDCTVLPASGDELVLEMDGRSSMTFYSIQSVGAHICDIMSNDEGHDDASGVGFKVNTASLTDSAPVLSINGLFRFIWVTCPTIGTSATVTALVCTANR